MSKAGRLGAYSRRPFRTAFLRTQRSNSSLDYVTGVVGAHYCYDPLTIGGIVVPTLRRVVTRSGDRALLSGRTSFLLDYTDMGIRQ
jgi:hypothetical protein